MKKMMLIIVLILGAVFIAGCSSDKITGGAIAGGEDRKSTRLNSSHTDISRMPSSA